MTVSTVITAAVYPPQQTESNNLLERNNLLNHQVNIANNHLVVGRKKTR